VLALRLFDRRVAERNIRQGIIDRKEYERYLKSLDDDAKEAVAATAALGPSGTPRDIEDAGE